jgi:SAM-dependent methyltransferase
MIASHARTDMPRHLDVGKMPGHWLMARLGKGVLRPGGVAATRWLLDQARIGQDDDVVEFAPGLGRTAAMILSQRPRTYTGIDRDEEAARSVERSLARAGFARARVLHGSAAAVPLPSGVATLVIGEAMLSMQTPTNKRAIVEEAWRLLRPGGRYLIHELAIAPDGLDAGTIARIEEDLSTQIHVGVRIGTLRDWTRWLDEAGFIVEETRVTPMRLLEPDRLIRDEGPAGALRFVFNAVSTPGALRRLRAIRRVFRTHQHHLCAIAIIAQRKTSR